MLRRASQGASGTVATWKVLVGPGSQKRILRKESVGHNPKVLDDPVAGGSFHKDWELTTAEVRGKLLQFYICFTRKLSKTYIKYLIF